MIALTSDEVARLLPITTAIDVVRAAMIEVSTGTCALPLRDTVPVGGKNIMGVMPGAMGKPACFGIKLISLFPGNAARGLSSHRGAYILFEAQTGGPVAIMDAALLTALRTAAASAVATDALACKDAARLALIGYGEQALHHLDAIRAVRPVIHVRVAGRDAGKAEAFCEAARKRFPKIAFQSGDDVARAVADASIICTTTAATDPILFFKDIPEGAHVNVVGSSIPSKREVDVAFVRGASIWVDYLPSAFAQAGEIIDVIAKCEIAETDLRGEIGSVLKGDIAARTSDIEITAYRSLGVAAQDLAAAHHIYAEAIKTGLGSPVSI